MSGKRQGRGLHVFSSSGGLQHATRRLMDLPTPLVQVVIPVHQETRPIERAVASVIEPGVVGAIVVAHNLPAAVFKERLAPFGSSVILLECCDGIPSPAGPLNAGLDASTALWVTCMGSDDVNQPGAAQAWADHLRARPADIVILPMVRAATHEFSIPTVRPGHTQDLDLVCDRLSYRTGPIMLVKRAMLRRYDIRMTEGLKTGEDLNWSLHAMSQATHIDLLKPGNPCYIETNEATDRVTAQRYPLKDTLAPAQHLAHQEWLHHQPARIQHAIALRVLRHSVLPAIARAFDSGGDTTDTDTPSGGLQHATRCRAGVKEPTGAHNEDRALARQVVAQWVQIDPRWSPPMSVAEMNAIRALLQPGQSWPSRQLKALSGTAKGGIGARLGRVLPSHPFGMFDPEARPRHLLAKMLNRAFLFLRNCRISGSSAIPVGLGASNNMRQRSTHHTDNIQPLLGQLTDVSGQPTSSAGEKRSRPRHSGETPCQAKAGGVR